jgi:hypothetical protein
MRQHVAAALAALPFRDVTVNGMAKAAAAKFNRRLAVRSRLFSRAPVTMAGRTRERKVSSMAQSASLSLSASTNIKRSGSTPNRQSPCA